MKVKNSIILFLLLSLICISIIPINVRASEFNNIKATIFETRVNNFTFYDQKLPSVCALDNETIVVVWESNEQEGTGLGYGVYGTVIDTTTGNNITAEFRVNDYTTNNQAFASICALSNEVVAVSWSSMGQDGSMWGVYTKVLNVITGTDLTSELQVNEYTSGYQYEPSICALSSDSYAIAWQSNQNAGVYDVYGRVFNATTGNPITGEFQVNNVTAGSQHRPSVCRLTQDSFAVSYESSGLDGDGFGVFGVVIDAATGNNVTREFQINDYTVSDQWFSSICALDNEKVAVTWRSNGQDGSSNGVYATVIDTTTCNNVTAELQINGETNNSQQNPSICALSSEIFVVAYESALQDGLGYGVYMNAIDVTTGDSIKSEYRANIYTIGNQRSSAICSLSNKDFTIAWESQGQDGDEYGIYFATFRLIKTGLNGGQPTSIPSYNFFIMIGAIGLSIMMILRKLQKKKHYS